MSILSVNRAEYESKLLEILEGLEAGFAASDISALRMSVINFVKVKLDELVPEGEGVIYSLSTAPNKTNPIDLLIDSHLTESTKDISLSAPKHLVYPQTTDDQAGTPFNDGDKCGYIALPTNFLRLYSLKMKDWTLDVFENTPLESHKHNKQRFIRAGYVKPIIVLNWKVISNVMVRVLEYYSINTSHDIESLLYIPSTATTDYTVDNWIDDNPNLIDSLAWMCAGKIMQITGQLEAAKYAMEQVKLSYQNL